jgi:hypothetical protein
MVPLPELATAVANLDELIARLSVMIPDLFEQTRHLCLPRVPDFEVHATKGQECRSVSSCFMPSHSDARYGFIRSPSEIVARRPARSVAPSQLRIGVRLTWADSATERIY